MPPLPLSLLEPFEGSATYSVGHVRDCWGHHVPLNEAQMFKPVGWVGVDFQSEGDDSHSRIWFGR